MVAVLFVKLAELIRKSVESSRNMEKFGGSLDIIKNLAGLFVMMAELYQELAEFAL